jgi:hypothetical protein
MITFVKKDIWNYLILQYLQELVKKFEDKLIGFVALDEQEQNVYESNVLIVLKEINTEYIKEILRIKREVEKKFEDKAVISPYIATEEEKDVIETFLKSQPEHEENSKLALENFESEIKKLPFILEVIIPTERIYESNVLIVLKEINTEYIKEILRIKREVEKKFEDKAVISPYIATEEEKDVIETFKRNIKGG